MVQRYRHMSEVSKEFSPDGKLVVTASRDHTARVWEVPASPYTRPGTE